MKKLFLPLLLMVAVSAYSAENPVLTIEGGQVQGVLADDHPDVFVYRGIPYAAPPIKDLRWKEPQPVVPWKGVKICDTFGHPSFGFMVAVIVRAGDQNQSSTVKNGVPRMWCSSPSTTVSVCSDSSFTLP